jgi:hypothetical protein
MGHSSYRKEFARMFLLYENRYFGDGSASPSILQVLEKALKFTEAPCEGGNRFRVCNSVEKFLDNISRL